MHSRRARSHAGPRATVHRRRDPWRRSTPSGRGGRSLGAARCRPIDPRLRPATYGSCPTLHPLTIHAPRSPTVPARWLINFRGPQSRRQQHSLFPSERTVVMTPTSERASTQSPPMRCLKPTLDYDRSCYCGVFFFSLSDSFDATQRERLRL
ncbi:unnamed protein product, partial [Iphiclides podalirius]